jgi:hypothetical protein
MIIFYEFTVKGKIKCGRIDEPDISKAKQFKNLLISLGCKIVKEIK